jgi:hypothetical protein
MILGLSMVSLFMILITCDIAMERALILTMCFRCARYTSLFKMGNAVQHLLGKVGMTLLVQWTGSKVIEY